MIHIAEPVTLDKLLPLIQKLFEGERERPRYSLTKTGAAGPPDCPTRQIRPHSQPKPEGHLRQSSQK